MRLIKIFSLLCIISFTSSCSSGNSEHVTSGTLSVTNGKNLLDLTYQTPSAVYSLTGLTGIFDLTIQSDHNNATLTPVRSTQIGESYTVEGKAFFSTSPCIDCLNINRFGLDESKNVVVGMQIKHPFPKGDPASEPSSANRLDLDIFDVSLAVAPVGVTPKTFDLTGVGIYPGILLNANGYTTDLCNVTGDAAALPYKICYENPDNNCFEMGTDWHEFELILNGSEMRFKLYLTMNYGISAAFLERLNPVYFIPEFNRKAAWRIDVSSETIYGNDSATIMIDIYDWNHGAVVSGDYPDTENPDHLKALSDINTVTVEVPGMTNTLTEATTTDIQTNGWDNPIRYKAFLVNENNLEDGNYMGLIKVTDTRIPGNAGESGSLVYTPDGVNLEFFDIDGFVTYQTFTINIEGNLSPQKRLEEKLLKRSAICYSPTGYDPTKYPQPVYPSEQDIRLDLETLFHEGGFDGVITYSSAGTLAEIPEIADSVGFNLVVMGIWDPADPEEINNAINASEYVDGYCVGNEQLYDLYSYPVLESSITYIRNATSLPVTTTEVWSDYTPELTTLGDWLFPNEHPYWAGYTDPASSVEYLEFHYNNMFDSGKFACIKEVGYPAAGDHDLSITNQYQFFDLVRDTDVVFAYFEAFDVPWKLTASVEPFWGLFYIDRVIKQPDDPCLGFSDPVPPIGSFDYLNGYVENCNPSDYKVVVYILVEYAPGEYSWFVKPDLSNPFTSILPDGTWTTDITTGTNDENAIWIMAFIVTDSYDPELNILPVINHETVWAVNGRKRN